MILQQKKYVTRAKAQRRHGNVCMSTVSQYVHIVSEGVLNLPKVMGTTELLKSTMTNYCDIVCGVYVDHAKVIGFLLFRQFRTSSCCRSLPRQHDCGLLCCFDGTSQWYSPILVVDVEMMHDATYDADATYGPHSI